MQTLMLDNLPTPVLLVWGLPEDAEGPFISPYQDGILGYWRYNGHLAVKVKIPKGNWKPIGKLSELTEEQAQAIVFRSRIGKYKDYKPATVSKEADPIGLINALLEMSKDTALESLHSAVEASGQETTTLPANTLIFKRV